MLLELLRDAGILIGGITPKIPVNLIQFLKKTGLSPWPTIVAKNSAKQVELLRKVRLGFGGEVSVGRHDHPAATEDVSDAELLEIATLALATPQTVKSQLIFEEVIKRKLKLDLEEVYDVESAHPLLYQFCGTESCQDLQIEIVRAAFRPAAIRRNCRTLSSTLLKLVNRDALYIAQRLCSEGE